jgi:hypothetical protein
VYCNLPNAKKEMKIVYENIAMIKLKKINFELKYIELYLCQFFKLSTKESHKTLIFKIKQNSFKKIDFLYKLQFQSIVNIQHQLETF